jgi:predicted DNA-binding WGR domain protein
VDTESYYQNANLLECDVLRPQLLRAFGWNVMLVLTKDWFEDEGSVVRAIVRQLSGGTLEGKTVPELAAEAAPSTGDVWKRYLELTNDAAQKFWEITVSGNQHTTRFGRIGETGQSKSKTFPDAQAAGYDASRLVKDKLAKGYVLIAE